MRISTRGWAKEDPDIIGTEIAPETTQVEEYGYSGCFPGVQGIVGIRQWDIVFVCDFCSKMSSESFPRHCSNCGRKVFVRLKSTSGLRDFLWKRENRADKVPSEYNENGLYAYRIDEIINHYTLGGIWGFVELRGTVIEHTDGELRAEWARVLELNFVQDSSICALFKGKYSVAEKGTDRLSREALEEIAASLSAAYAVPVNILSQEQSENRMREVLNKSQSFLIESGQKK